MLGQIQASLFDGVGWSSLTRVPYALACSPFSYSSLRAFEECDASVDGLPPDRPNTLGADRSTTLTADPSLAGSAMPARIGLYAGWRLLPDGSVSSTPDTMSGTTGTTWPQLLCDSLGATAPCRVDTPLGDGDGWPTAGDCAPSDNTRYPYRTGVEPPTPGDGVDHNCDTWAWPLGALGGSP